MSNKTINLFILPSENKNNLYIRLLKESLREVDNLNLHDLKDDNLKNIFSALRLIDHSDSLNTLHIQWPTVLYGSKFAFKSLFLIIRNISILLILKKFYNFHIIWTVHNNYSHDYPNALVDKIGTLMVFCMADRIICQQKKTAEEYKKIHPKKSIHFIPHGNYIDKYGHISKRNVELRRSFGFSDEDIVFISLGAITPYKLNEKIIEAVQHVRTKRRNLKLIIVGKGNPAYVQSLLKYIDDGIVIKNIFVQDKDIPAYLACADYSIFYYDQSEMTSGSIILSLSYGVPVITRNIPASEIINSSNGYVFNSDSELEKILLGVSVNRFDNMNIINTIKEHDWISVARQTIGVYRINS